MKRLFILTLLIFLSAGPVRAESAKAHFAMGCFWCAEHDYEKREGILDVVSGYMGGEKETATYKQVSKGDTGHFETVEVTYDPGKISYQELVTIFWDNVDPFDAQGQFCDKGRQYSAVIFVANDNERDIATSSLAALQKRHPQQKVAIEILDSKPFYPAEAEHQNFADTNRIQYKLYRAGCGRDKRLEELSR